jgi:hypothetical protein
MQDGDGGDAAAQGRAAAGAAGQLPSAARSVG